MPGFGGIVAPQAALEAGPGLVVAEVVAAGQLGRDRAHVAAALHVVLPAQRHEAGAVAPDVPGEQREVDQREHVVGRVVVLGDAQRPADLRAVGAARRRARDRGSGPVDAGDLLRALERVRLDRRAGSPRTRWSPRATNASFTSPAWMISRPIALASAMSVPTSRPSHASAHCAVDVRRGSTEYMRVPVLQPLQHVVEEDRVRLPRVGAPEHQQVGVLSLDVRRGAATRSEHCRQTDDRGSVSSAVAGVDVVAAHHDPRELLGGDSSSRSWPSSS